MKTILILLAVLHKAFATTHEKITGTIFCDNDFSFYVNGRLIKQDPITTFPHNAVNVTFTIPRDEDIVFAIEARDWADEVTGLEYDNRCVGDGGLRMMFSNSVVSNSSWVCTGVHYGPENWKTCFGAQRVRNQTLQLLPACKASSTPQLVGCQSQITPRPDGWNQTGFDDSRWDYALEYTDQQVGWGLRPANCTIPSNTISSEVDPNGDPITCPENLNWGDSKFIWRKSLDLDNIILCRFTIRSSGVIPTLSVLVLFLATMIAQIMIIA